MRTRVITFKCRDCGCPCYASKHSGLCRLCARPCSQCGGRNRSQTSEYCSLTCKRTARSHLPTAMQAFACACCGLAAERPRRQSAERYCSNACMHAHQSAKKRRAAASRHPNCLICGKACPRWFLRCCSRACSSVARKGKLVKERSEQFEVVSKPCAVCGSPMQVRLGGRYIKKYCSMACARGWPAPSRDFNPATFLKEVSDAIHGQRIHGVSECTAARG